MSAQVKKFNIVFAAKSDMGLVRTDNQDSFGKFPEESPDFDYTKGQLFIVADGMGGHKGGKEASSIAVKTVNTEFFNSTLEESVALKEAIEKANNVIFSKSGDKSEYGRMGTTCSTLLLKGDKGIIGHVGDSRIYKIENRTIEQLTNDHTKVQEMLREGILTPEEAINYPSKSVLARALGVDEQVRVDIISDIKLKRGQSYILCSDGLAKVGKAEILDIVTNNTPKDACNILVDLANERGGKDNVTVIVIKIDPEAVVKVSVAKPVKKRRKRPRQESLGWIAVIVLFLVIAVLLYLQYQDTLFSSSSGETVRRVTTTRTSEPESKSKPTIDLDYSDKKLLDNAEQLVNEKSYETAYLIYKSMLDNKSMRQAALTGIDKIVSAYISLGDKLKDDRNFEDALSYYKKAEAIQPDNEKIKNLINLCNIQLNQPEPETKPESVTQPQTTTNPPPPKPKTSSVLSVSKFDSPGWIYPGGNKNEYNVSSSELSFINTSGEKFIIYDKDLFDVTVSVNTLIEDPNSVLGIVIGYSSPLDYYLFKYRTGGDYTLQRIKGNDIEKLLVIRPRDSGKSSNRKMRIIYSNNLISLYDQDGLINSYRSVWGIFGKAGIYVSKNSSVKFRNIQISGKTQL